MILKNFLFIYFLISSFLSLVYLSNDILLLIFIVLYPLIFIFYMYRNCKIQLNDPIVFFIICFSLYGFFAPLSELLLHSNITHSTRIASFLYTSALIGCFIGLLIRKKSIVTFNDEVTKIHFNIFTQIFIVINILILFSYKIFNAGFDIQKLNNLNSVERHDIDQLWVVSSYLISGLFLFSTYYWKKFSKNVLLILIICLTLYILFQLSLGNRRDFTSILLGCFYIYTLNKKSTYSVFTTITLVCSIFIMMLFSSLRAGFDSIEYIYIDLLTSNEFTYPFYTLSISIENNYSDWLYGYSLFIMPIAIFIPRVIWSDKMNSLAYDFILRNFGEGSMGYAFTPVTEAFMNFGFVGPFLVFFIFGFFLLSLACSSKYSRLKSIWAFLFFSLTLDFCRGEFSGFFYQISLVSLPFLIYLLLIFLGNKK